MILQVNTSLKYNVIIDSGIASNIGNEFLKLFPKCKVLLITDSKVPQNHVSKIGESISKSSYMLFNYVIESGESSKNITNYSNILNYLAENNFSRKDLVVAVGGGVVGDLSAFVASTYMRGVKFVNVPTTLLSCVDSSVGGKTGINLDCGKNLVGTFYQPSLVYIDTDFLQTLPIDIFNDGMGEVIKYGLMDKSVWDILKSDKPIVLSELIYNCLKIKIKIVEEDEKESGLRQVLNLGHTFGHAIETLSSYKILHGFAVIKGIVLVAKMALNNKDITINDYQEILSVIEKFKIDYSCPYSIKDLKEVMVKDKKANNGVVNLIYIKNIGNVIINKININEIKI